MSLRQFLTALDFYCALLIAVPAAYFRLTGEAPKDAEAPLTMVLIIMLSTMALTLFGLEGESGMTRYRLSPIAGWRILAAKGASFLLLALLLTAALSPIGGLAGGLVCLTFGNWASTRAVQAQSRWRFRASTPFGLSLAQMILALLAFGVVTQISAWWLLACFGIYGLSLWWCGRALTSRSQTL